MKFLSRDLLYLALLIMLVKVAIKQRTAQDDVIFVDPTIDLVENTEPAPLLPPPAEPERVMEQTIERKIEIIETPEMAPAPEPAGQETPPVDETPQPNLDDPKLKEDTLKKIDATQQQVETALPMVKQTSVQAAHMHSLKQKLVQLRRSYQDSLATPIFGPHYTTNNVEQTAENHIEKDLLRVINKLGTIIHALIQEETEPFAPSESIIEGLQNNQAMLQIIAS